MNVSMRVLAVGEWNKIPISRLYAVIKIFQIESSLRFFYISSLNILAVYT